MHGVPETPNKVSLLAFLCIVTHAAIFDRSTQARFILLIRSNRESVCVGGTIVRHDESVTIVVVRSMSLGKFSGCDCV